MLKKFSSLLGINGMYQPCDGTHNATTTSCDVNAACNMTSGLGHYMTTSDTRNGEVCSYTYTGTCC